MKTYDQRTADIAAKINQKTKQKRMVKGICLSTALVVLALILFVPYSTTPPSVERYADSPYYGLIQKLNEVTFQPPQYANNFEAVFESVRDFGMMGMTGSAPNADYESSGTGLGEYVEVTDNQVSGVIEGDLFKRSDRYIYYLRDLELSVYDINQADSKQVGSYRIGEMQDVIVKPYGSGDTADTKIQYFGDAELYLSADCTTVTVLFGCYEEDMGRSTVLVTLDVTDPANIRENGRIYLTGQYISSRMVEGSLLVTQNYSVGSHDFADPQTFVPSYGTPESMTCIPPENILCPDSAQADRYTVVYLLDGSTLEVEGSAALLGYSQELYVSAETIYATHLYDVYGEKDENGVSRQDRMTQISGISYAGDTLVLLGTVTLEGSVKDQYSMDQYDGMLRVVTTTRSWDHRRQNGYDTVSMQSRNVNLYCIDLENWEVAASVIGFAPEGEEATSVRFDGDHAYVCTAEVVSMTDPVYFFDLSDVENITYTDTGTIDGYSTSLIQLGEGYLMGVGYGDSRQLKIEIYEEVDGKVVSVCSYEAEAMFSEEYKSYLIDRERKLIGLGLSNQYYVRDDCYVLLHFDGYGLTEVTTVPISGTPENVRAALIDGWIYVLSDDFAVQQVW